ncbi:myeloid leukemia factor 1-like [Sinocyclocheilus grahami]|uniref:myeloid leukemia factor 1-like n=1 Tax=Sinocyclocheilus grahami TaxID=75366 RepID=UPI0007AD285D|nr:PREDICTED: myeloid leukemia factor 1-like [Sinocyclocheilus grahami]
MLRQQQDEPFFADPFQLHHERMQQMMGGFSDPFGHRGHGGHRAAAQPNTGPNDRSSRVSVSYASYFFFSQTVLLCNLIDPGAV